MGQKVNSNGLRIALNKSWQSKWCENKHYYANLLHEDIKISNYLKTTLNNLNILHGECVIKRSRNRILVEIAIYNNNMYTSEELNTFRLNILDVLDRLVNSKIQLTFKTLTSYMDNSQLLANYLASQLEKRKSYRELFKKIIQEVRQEPKIRGIRINCSGRLDGAEIARTEWVKEGQVSLHTLKAKIDYAVASANTMYGVCGIKVWLCYV